MFILLIRSLIHLCFIIFIFFRKRNKIHVCLKFVLEKILEAQSNYLSFRYLIFTTKLCLTELCFHVFYVRLSPLEAFRGLRRTLDKWVWYNTIFSKSKVILNFENNIFLHFHLFKTLPNLF